MISKIRILLATNACLLAFCLQGCSSGEDVPDRPDTVPVTGVVKYKGEPVTGAIVTFSPNSKQERGATGKTNDSGEFELMTFESGDGAIPGLFLIAVEKVEVIGGGDTDNSLAPPAEYKDLLPKKYKSPSTSSLSAKVEAEGENNITLELAD